MINVTIIIPIKNSEKTLRSCVDAIKKSIYTLYEIIVVDDNSNDKSVSIAKEMDCKVIRSFIDIGAAKARNLGVKNAQGKYIVFIDSDVIIENIIIGKMIDVLEKDTNKAAVYGSYKYWTPAKSFWSKYKNIFHHFTHQISNEESNSFWAGCGAVKKEIFEQVKGFDEAFNKAGLEDVAFGYKLNMNGFKVYLLKNVQVLHLKNYTFFNLILSDIKYRAYRWTKFILYTKSINYDLITTKNQRNSLVIIYIMLLFFIKCFFKANVLDLIIIITCFVLYIFINLKFIIYTVNKYSIIFGIQCLFMHLLFYIYSGVGAFFGIFSYIIKKSFKNEAGDFK